VKRQRDEPGSYGGAPLSVQMKKSTMHLYYNPLLTPGEIAPLILSPRKASSGVDVQTVQGLLDFFETYHHVEDLHRAPPAKIRLERRGCGEDLRKCGYA